MKRIAVAAVIIFAAFTKTFAKEDDFAVFARTKDSLMHIAFYDKDFAAYKKYFNEFLAAYNKQDTKNKEEYRSQLEDEYYYLARAYAVKGDKVNALASLEKSKYYDHKELVRENDFNNIRKEPRFMKFLATAKNQKSKYQLIIQKEASYNDAEQNSLPPFTYQSAGNPNLAALKNRYDLDSIAGEGNDVSKIINLMKWVHYLIPHDGSKGNPEVKNATSLIRECRRDCKTLNCRGLAIVLNEVYLAAGFKSRFVTCLPKDTADNDCHVITMVWSTSLNKWLWMDPTFMAYVMDEEGTLLGIEEVRGRIAHNKPLILNPDANRNHATSQSKNWYLDYYMAKNLYRLECAISSEYSYETKGDGKTRAYIQLLPGKTIPETVVSKNAHGVDVYTRYYTNSLKTFWAKPEGIVVAAKAGNGHTAADYEKAMTKFKDCYNSGSGNCVDKLLVPESKGWINDKHLKEMQNEYGKILAVKYLSMELDNPYQDVALFQMTCEKSVHCMGISLDENSKIGTLRFKTTSNYIDWVLAKAIDKERNRR
ncbi:MAG: hypothetical protein K0Q79_1583 [Flavipsychrobacter sp.]|jgi:hypothetical protein|nr:hypothetical protein [Flavipsychrobacter sp.]